MPDRTPAQRDHRLRVVRRLRYGVVSAGVLGSLSVAGVVATSTPDASAEPGPDRSSTAAQPLPPVQGDTFSRLRASRHGTSEAPRPHRRKAPVLKQGFGSSHASSGAS